jgi:hypothetical protein
MIAYRCYLLGEDGKIKRAEVIECSTDAAALEEAERRLETCGYSEIEVWDKGRRIGIVENSKGNYESSVYATGHTPKPHAASVVASREAERRSSKA